MTVVFTATNQTQDIKLWDIRSRALVYDLATGNNTVEAMIWDHASNVLYAASDCPNVDRNGYHMNYRYAKIPRTEVGKNEQNLAPEANMDEDEDAWEDIEEDDDYDEEVCWPRKAYHSENYFGHVFDAGNHRLCEFPLLFFESSKSYVNLPCSLIDKFSFKENPNPGMLPHYGSATVDRGSHW